jgi:hypothetical protein
VEFVLFELLEDQVVRDGKHDVVWFDICVPSISVQDC